MSVRFLTDAWANAMTEALNADPDFRDEAKKRTSVIAWHVETPGGPDLTYHLSIKAGHAELRIGEPSSAADLNLTASYDDLAALSRGDMDGRQAFQRKRLRADARLVRILKYLPVFHALNRVAQGIEIDYSR